MTRLEIGLEKNLIECNLEGFIESVYKNIIMRTLSLLLFILISSGAVAQKRDVDVKNFSSVSLGIPAVMNLKQGSSEKIAVKCDQDIFDEITFEKKGDRLIIKREGSWKWGSGWKKSDVTIYITMKDIEGVSISGSGLIESDGELNVDELKLSISGSGDMNLKVDAQELALGISGSGTIGLSGAAEVAASKISGSGKVRAEDLTVSVFKASISGSGDCYITATDEINARISGSGTVHYSGEPSKIISNSSGSGKVKKI